METLGRVLLALFVPIAWGIVSAWAFDRLRARRATRSSGSSLPGNLSSLASRSSESEGECPQ